MSLSLPSAPPSLCPCLGCLENYNTVLSDCAAVIAADTHTPSRGYYRAGFAPFMLELLYEALDCVHVLGTEGRSGGDARSPPQRNRG